MLGFGWFFPRIQSTIASAIGGAKQYWENWWCPATWETTDILWEDAKMTTCSVYNNNLTNWESIATNWENT